MFTIYCATNKVNHMKYIGVCCAWPRRKFSHESSARTEKGYKQRFHLAIRKYGQESFEWEILLQTPNKEYAYEMEVNLIDQYQTTKGKGYNNSKGGEHSHYGHLHSEETKKLISQSNTNIPNVKSRTVYTPFGEFPGMQMASRALNLNTQTIKYRCQSSGFPGWVWKNSSKQIYLKDGRYQEINTPFGIFKSVELASISLNIPNTTIRDRVRSLNFAEWYPTGNKSNSSMKEISSPFGIFESASTAAKVLNIPRPTIQAKIRSKKQTDWNFL